MPAILTKALARGNAGPLLRVLVLCLSLLLFFWLGSREVAAQNIPPTLTPWGGLDTLYARMVYARNQELAARSASAAGLEVASAGTVSVMEGSTLAGKVVINELRVVPLARISARVATASAPIAIAMIAADLVNFGITQCQQSASGWCKPGAVNSNSTDIGFTGYVWRGAGGDSDSAYAACAAAATVNQTVLSSVTVNGPNGACLGKWINDGSPAGWGVSQIATCVKNYVVVSGVCKPDPGVKVDPLPMTYPELSDKLAQALTGNPDRAKDYWGITPLDGWKAWFDDPSSQSKVAEVVNPADGKVNGTPRTSTTSAGTTTTNTQYTIKPNTDANTLRDAPVTAGTTVTVTNPDGSTTTVTTGDAPISGGGGAAPKVEVKSCGLADTAPCKIDETGTPTVADGKTAIAVAQSDLTQTRQDAQTNFTTVNQGRSFDLHMPHLLPGGTCQPVEWYSWGTWRGSWDPCDSMAYVRTLLSWLWYTLAAMYIWNRTASANAGAQ